MFAELKDNVGNDVFGDVTKIGGKGKLFFKDNANAHWEVIGEMGNNVLVKTYNYQHPYGVKCHGGGGNKYNFMCSCVAHVTADSNYFSMKKSQCP